MMTLLSDYTTLSPAMDLPACLAQSLSLYSISDSGGLLKLFLCPGLVSRVFISWRKGSVAS